MHCKRVCARWGRSFLKTDLRLLIKCISQLLHKKKWHQVSFNCFPSLAIKEEMKAITWKWKCNFKLTYWAEPKSRSMCKFTLFKYCLMKKLILSFRGLMMSCSLYEVCFGPKTDNSVLYKWKMNFHLQF